MRFWALYAAAWCRGLSCRWPQMPPIPAGYSGVSCGLHTPGECRGMYRHGWEPWSFQRTRLPGGAGIAASFRVPLTADEIAHLRWQQGREAPRPAIEHDRRGEETRP